MAKTNRKYRLFRGHKNGVYGYHFKLPPSLDETLEIYRLTGDKPSEHIYRLLRRLKAQIDKQGLELSRPPDDWGSRSRSDEPRTVSYTLWVNIQMHNLIVQNARQWELYWPKNSQKPNIQGTMNWLLQEALEHVKPTQPIDIEAAYRQAAELINASDLGVAAIAPLMRQLTLRCSDRAAREWLSKLRASGRIQFMRRTPSPPDPLVFIDHKQYAYFKLGEPKDD